MNEVKMGLGRMGVRFDLLYAEDGVLCCESEADLKARFCRVTAKCCEVDVDERKEMVVEGEER